MGKLDLMKKGLAQEKLKELKQLVLRIDNSCKSISQNLFMYDGLDSLEIEAAEAEFRELKTNVRRYHVLAKEIEKNDPDVIIPRSPAEV